jgi:serine phosphatase RsbU (regulator of sigma subunit)
MNTLHNNNSQKPRILIVDDEPFNVDYLEQELEDSGFVLLTAGNGQDALETVRSESLDLVLLDIMMPVMDGFEVLSRLKADRATRDIPVIIISANDDLQSVVKGITMGAEDHLPKPFEPALLNARISSSLERKRLQDLQKLYLESLEREMVIAREIQSGFLPTFLPDVEGWQIGVLFESAREVAGDFYDAFLLPDGNLAFVTGDVCGKGVGAALFMTLFRSLIRASATSHHLSSQGKDKTVQIGERLNEIITFTNHYVAETHADANMFATVFIGIIDINNGTLYYINCGNDPAILIRNGEIAATLPPSGPAIGIIPDADFTVHQVVMEMNDLLAAFSDGIADTLNEADEPFGSKRLLDRLKDNQMPPHLLVEQIKEELNQFIGSAMQFDDISLLVIKRG